MRRRNGRAMARAAGALALLLLTSAGSAAAQTRDELQIWTAMLGTAHTEPAPPGLAFWLDVHLRRGEGGTVFIGRPAVGVQVTDWLSLWAGYAWVPVFSDDNGDTLHEHRAWQQVILQHRIAEAGLALQSRTRFEQRFVAGASDPGLRLRHFARLGWQPSADVPLGLAVWDELFLGLGETSWGQPGGIDQNRIFVGPFLRMNRWVRFEAGYLFVYLDRGDRDLRAHVRAVNLFLTPRPARR